jgi:hypothetical protein
MITVKFNVKELNPPIFWIEDGRIHCSTGSSIGYEDERLTEASAIVLSVMARTALTYKPKNNKI